MRKAEFISWHILTLTICDECIWFFSICSSSRRQHKLPAINKVIACYCVLPAEWQIKSNLDILCFMTSCGSHPSIIELLKIGLDLVSLSVQYSTEGDHMKFKCSSQAFETRHKCLKLLKLYKYTVKLIKFHSRKWIKQKACVKRRFVWQTLVS